MLPICCLWIFFSIPVMRPYLTLYYDFTWIFWKGSFRLWDLKTLPNNQSEKSINIYISMNRESFGLWQCRWSWHTSASSKTCWRPEEGKPDLLFTLPEICSVGSLPQWAMSSKSIHNQVISLQDLYWAFYPQRKNACVYRMAKEGKSNKNEQERSHMRLKMWAAM